ncbi:7332_t:CDS:1, partial [Acaulospora colombiana]
MAHTATLAIAVSSILFILRDFLVGTRIMVWLVAVSSSTCSEQFSLLLRKDLLGIPKEDA